MHLNHSRPRNTSLPLASSDLRATLSATIPLI